MPPQKPLHPKAAELFKRGLYSGLKSFAEFEKRISAIDNDREKGAAFEIFTEALLATQRKYDVAELWPSNSAPLALIKKLSLNNQDYGVCRRE